MRMASSDTVYSDFNITFLPDPVTGDLQKVENDDAVKQSIRLLVLTALNERVFQPGLGSTLRQTLFEPLDDITTTVLVKTMADVIRQFEPRAELEYIDVHTDKTPSGELLDSNSIWVEFVVRVLNLPGLVSTGVLLRRLR